MIVLPTLSLNLEGVPGSPNLDANLEVVSPSLYLVFDLYGRVLCSVFELYSHGLQECIIIRFTVGRAL